MLMPPEPKFGEKLICPICKKEYKANDDTKYIRAGGYTCSWKCFLEYDKIPNDEQIKLKSEYMNYLNSLKSEPVHRKRRIAKNITNGMSDMHEAVCAEHITEKSNENFAQKELF